MYSINKIEFHERQNKSSINRARSYAEGFPAKLGTKRSGSPLFFESSSIIKKQNLRKSAEKKSQIFKEEFIKTRDSFWRQSNKAWLFASDRTDTNEQNLNTNIFQLLEEENGLRASKKQEKQTTLYSTIPDDLRRNIAFRRLAIPNKDRTAEVRKPYYTTTSRFLPSHSQKISQLNSVQTEKGHTHGDEFCNSERGANRNQKLFCSSSEFIHLDHIDYKNYKYQPGEKSYVLSIPAKKLPVRVFHNQTETIENAIERLHIQRLYMRNEDSNIPQDFLGVEKVKRSSSLNEFEKTLGMAKLKQLEEFNLQQLAKQRKQAERESFAMNKIRNISQQNCKDTVVARAHPTMNQSTSSFQKTVRNSPIKHLDYFRKTHFKEFKFGSDGEVMGSDSSTRKQLLRQEFLYYSEVSRRFLEDLGTVLHDRHDRRVNGYSLEDYKELASKYRK